MDTFNLDNVSFSSHCQQCCGESTVLVHCRVHRADNISLPTESKVQERKGREGLEKNCAMVALTSFRGTGRSSLPPRVRLSCGPASPLSLNLTPISSVSGFSSLPPATPLVAHSRDNTPVAPLDSHRPHTPSNLINTAPPGTLKGPPYCRIHRAIGRMCDHAVFI
jgi:hypothetical protein